MEELCLDCPLRDICSTTIIEAIDSVRVDPTDPEDIAQLQALDYGETALHALRQHRPDRCTLLRTVLPKPPRDRVRTRSYAQCPEVGLMGVVAEDLL